MRPVQVKQVAGYDQFELLYSTPRCLFGHLRDEPAIGMRIQITPENEVRVLAVTRNYV